MNVSPMQTIEFPFETPPAEGEATEVAEGILWIRLPLPMALDHVNVYAIREDGGWCIVDTGYKTKRTIAVWEKVLAGPLKGDPVTRVLLTHHHPDHVGLVGWFQSEKGAELWTTRTAWLYSRMMVLDEQEVWPEETLEFYRSAGMDAEIFEERRSQRPYNFADVVYPMPLGFRRIKDGDVITIGSRDWLVLTGSGHSPEHATLWSQNDNLVIAGDQILPGITPNIGVYPTEPMGDPVAEWIESCQKFASVATEDHFVLPGHKLPFTGLPARMKQLEDNHHHALERLLEFLATPHSATECFHLLFKRNIGKLEYGFALVEAMAHLNHLLLKGDIERFKDEKGAWKWHQKGYDE